MSEASLEQLRQVVKKNPELFEMLTGSKPRVGRTRGPKKPQVQHGEVFEVPVPPVTDEPQPITLAQAKRMLKCRRKPRVLSEESKLKMLENLKKGRESYMLKKQSMRETEIKQTANKHESIPTKKYIVKQPTPKRQKKYYENKSNAVSEEESVSEDDVKTARLKETERMLEKIERIQQQFRQSVPSQQPKYQTKPPTREMAQPPLQRQGAFRMFY